MIKTVSPEAAASACVLINQRIAELGGWRGEVLAHVGRLIVQALPDVAEEWKWSVPVW